MCLDCQIGVREMARIIKEARRAKEEAHIKAKEKYRHECRDVDYARGVHRFSA